MQQQHPHPHLLRHSIEPAGPEPSAFYCSRIVRITDGIKPLSLIPCVLHAIYPSPRPLPPPRWSALPMFQYSNADVRPTPNGSEGDANNIEQRLIANSVEPEIVQRHSALGSVRSRQRTVDSGQCTTFAGRRRRSIV
jgi:hypothetical protein